MILFLKSPTSDASIDFLNARIRLTFNVSSANGLYSLKNKVLGGKVIQGNRYDSIADKQDCCNLCTNHPMCTGWVYDSMQVCILKQGEQAYEENSIADEITTWAGRPSGVACTQ